MPGMDRYNTARITKGAKLAFPKKSGETEGKTLIKAVSKNKK